MVEYIESNIGAIIANVLTGPLIFICSEIIKYFIKPPSLRKQKYALSIVLSILVSSAAAIWSVHLIETPPEARPVFSDFNLFAPVNNYGVHWGVFNDNPYNGNSDVGIKAQASPGNVGTCFVLNMFHLGPESSINPYVGVVSGFSAKTVAALDVSHFSGVRFNVWNQGKFPDDIRVYLQVSPAQIINWYDGYFEYDVTDYAMKLQPPQRLSYLSPCLGRRRPYLQPASKKDLVSLTTVSYTKWRS